MWSSGERRDSFPDFPVKPESVYSVSCLKQSLKMEAVVLHRVGFLDNFCPKQGQDFNPSAAPPIPKHGSSTLPPGGKNPQEEKNIHYSLFLVSMWRSHIPKLKLPFLLRFKFHQIKDPVGTWRFTMFSLDRVLLFVKELVWVEGCPILRQIYA